jgi:hypothetical protein
VGFSFEEFIETNLMVQSEFNLTFLFASYNIFLLVELVDPTVGCDSRACISPASRLPRCFWWSPWPVPVDRYRARNSVCWMRSVSFAVPGADFFFP